MRFTDIFIKRPVLATVVSLMILVLGLRSLGQLPVRQFPYTENAVVTVTTVYTGADPEVVAGFITTPLENSISQANGIDYMTSTSTQSVSTISIFLRLNYDAVKALAEINTKINATLNQLPKNAQLPTVTIQVGQTIDAMYIGFYSDVLEPNQITDYIVREVQPKLQAITGVQQAEVLGDRQYAMRIFVDPTKLAGFNLTMSDISNALANNDIITAVGRTDGAMFTVNMTASTNLTTVSQFRKMVIKAQNGAIIRLEDVANVSLGSRDYDKSVSFNGKQSVYVGILITPTANLLNVVRDVKQLLPTIQNNLPEGLNARIVYDSTEFVNSSIYEVVMSILEAIVIVTAVIFVFLGSFRAVLIPLVTIPLSLIGGFFIMYLLDYSVNLLTLLSLVLAIGLVVDDAIIVVENIQRHMEEGLSRLEATLIGARELANPIIAISIVLIAVYVPIGFMGGLLGALFSEFAFTLAGTVGISAVVALTLSPMMCNLLLKVPTPNEARGAFITYVDKKFDALRDTYQRALHHSLDLQSVTAVFTVIVLVSIYFLYSTSRSELAPQEDQSLILTQFVGAPNATLDQTRMYSNLINKLYFTYPETDRVFQLDGITGLNSSMIGMSLKPWEQRKRTTNDLVPLIQQQLDSITGGIIAAFQLPSLPGARGLPIQFVVGTTEPFERLNEVVQEILVKAEKTGMFIFIDSDLKIDKTQTNIVLDRDKISEFGLNMQDIANVLSGALSQGYINYFNYLGRAYQVIPQITREQRQNASQILNYYINTSKGTSVALSTVAHLTTKVVPDSLNHFQQVNAATLSGVPFPGVSMGQALDALNQIAKEVLPVGYFTDFAGPSRQFVQEGSGILLTFFFAFVIIFLSLAALFESFRDPLIILVSVPMSIFGAMIFISLSVAGLSLNIYTQVGLVTLIGLISKHGILIVQFANDLQREGKTQREAIESAASIRLRPILMTSAAMVLGVVPLILANGAGAASRLNIGVVIASGVSIGTFFTLFVVPSMYLFLSSRHLDKELA